MFAATSAMLICRSFHRFFERIAKTYRRESWESLLHPLLSQWYACAQQLGDMELSVKLLIEMLAYGAPELYRWEYKY